MAEPSGPEEDLRQDLEHASENDSTMEAEGSSGGQKILQPVTPEALAAFEEAQRKAGIVYVSRIPPGMRPQKIRQIMSAYGEVGRAYLVPEGEHIFSSD